MKKTINLIFDMDGCLIDSTEVQKMAFYGAYDEIVGDTKCPNFSEYIKNTGDSLPNIFKKMNLPVKMAKPFRRISDELIGKIIINTECIELIKKFKNNGSKIAICTGKDHYRAKNILINYNIDKYFDELISADDVLEPKPSAIPIMTAINKLDVSKNTCVVIGDGYNDIISARNAGVCSILTLWYGDQGVPREADYTVSTVEELERLLYDLANK